MADALRQSVCQYIQANRNSFLEFYAVDAAASTNERTFDDWLAQLAQHGQGDQLALLALATITDMPVQTVHGSGCHIPLMDPNGKAPSHGVSYWGYSRAHWVWLASEPKPLDTQYGA